MADRSRKKKSTNNQDTMKNFLFSILLISLLTACESSPKNLGEQFAVKNPVSVNDVLTQLNSNNSAKDLQIEGKIEKSCMSEGCWFTIKDAGGAEILFDIKDKAFKVPTNSPGKTVIALADAAQDSSSEQKFTLSVRGLLFK